MIQGNTQIQVNNKYKFYDYYHSHFHNKTLKFFYVYIHDSNEYTKEHRHRLTKRNETINKTRRIKIERKDNKFTITNFRKSEKRISLIFITLFIEHMHSFNIFHNFEESERKKKQHEHRNKRAKESLRVSRHLVNLNLF